MTFETFLNLPAQVAARIGFTHSAFPADCVSPNLMSIEGVEEFPGFGGTGFFARRGDAVFYITARHCLTKQDDVDIASLATQLHIPYTLTGSTRSTDDYVQFAEVLSLKHDSADIPGQFVDVLVLTIRRPRSAVLYASLIQRAVKLPPNGRWLDSFVAHPMVKDDLKATKGIRFTVIGYPEHGTDTQITYPEGAPIEIVTQVAEFSGYLSEGTGPDRLMLNDVSWKGDLNGFSGSPVIVQFRNSERNNYALAGMMVSGGAQKAQFVRISLITEALKLA